MHQARSGLALLLLIASCLTGSTPARAEAIGQALTTHPADQRSPVISGDRVVWVDSRHGTPELYLYDILTGQERRLTTNTVTENCPSLSGHRLTWVDDRTGVSRIYLYDLQANTERLLPTTGNSILRACAAIDGTRVAWAGDSPAHELYVFDVVTNVQQSVPSHPTNDRRGVRIRGTRIISEVWDNPGPWHTWVVDLATGVEQRVGTNAATQEDADLSGNLVVTYEYRGPRADLFLYDLTTGQERQLTNDAVDQLSPLIDGQRIIWADLRNNTGDLFLFDLSTNTEVPIAVHPSILGPYGISGDRIVWEDHRGGSADIYLTDLIPDQGAPMHELARGREAYHIINFPWGKYHNGTDWVFTYGMDFGFCPLTEARRVVNNPQIVTDLDTLQGLGVEGVRWFVIPDGRNLTFNASRTATGRGAGFRDDLWRVLDLLESRGMSVMLTLIDGNQWFKPEDAFQGALFGHATSIIDPAKRQALYTTVIVPILQDLAAWHAANPARRFPVSSIDLGNELEFGTHEHAGTGVTIAQMQTYVREAAALVHQQLPRVPVTVGARDAQAVVDYWTDGKLSVAAGQGLDFFSFHHHGTEPLQGPNGLRARFGLDQLGKRVYLQEFPGKNPPLGSVEMYLAPIGGTRGTRTSEGWLSGSHLWSFNGNDDPATPIDPVATLQQIAAWFANAFDRPDLLVSRIAHPEPIDPGEVVTFDFTVANQGGVTAGNNRFEAFVDGQNLIAQTLPPIAPGDTHTVTSPAWSGGTGDHFLWSKADVFLQVGEANEDNNEGTKTVVVSGPLPDLVVSSATRPSPVIAGQSVAWTITVTNQGSLAAAPSRFELWIDGVQLGVAATPDLAPGAGSTFTLPSPGWTATPGTHNVWMKTDVWLEVVESNEDNNEFTETVTAAGPDLVMTAVTGPASAFTGSSIAVTTTVRNQGAVSVGSSSVGIYLSADAVITTADQRVGTRSIGTLAAGASSTGTTTVNLSNTLAPGAYYLGAIADYTNARAEADETNNALTGAAITLAPGADLILTALSGPPSAVTGGPMAVTSTVANQGTGSAGSFSIGIYLSVDAVITTADRRIGTRFLSSLAAGTSSAGTTTVSIPNTLVPGTYRLGAIADYNSVRAETNETNNAFTAGTVAVGPGADFTLTALSGPVTAVRGTSAAIASTVMNAGAGLSPSFTVGYYLSVDAVITTADRLIAIRSLSALAAGASSNANFSATIPSTLAPGTYVLGAIADPSNTVPESNETNNIRTGGTVQVQ